MTRAVRGAILAKKNERSAIYEAAVRLAREITSANEIRDEDIVSILFSLTDDLDAGNPAAALREVGFVETPLFCVQEAKVEGGMAKVIRVLLTFNGDSDRKPVAVYLDGAEALRPDIAWGRKQR